MEIWSCFFGNSRIRLTQSRIIWKESIQEKGTKKKKLYGPFLWMGFNCLKAKATLRRQITFYHSVPRNSWYAFYRPRKDEWLSRPWSHLVVLNTGPLARESSALTTRPLLKQQFSVQCVILIFISFKCYRSIVNSIDFYLFILSWKGSW